VSSRHGDASPRHRALCAETTGRTCRRGRFADDWRAVARRSEAAVQSGSRFGVGRVAAEVDVLPVELPVGVLTAAIGAPYLLYPVSDGVLVVPIGTRHTRQVAVRQFVPSEGEFIPSVSAPSHWLPFSPSLPEAVLRGLRVPELPARVGRRRRAGRQHRWTEPGGRCRPAPGPHPVQQGPARDLHDGPPQFAPTVFAETVGSCGGRHLPRHRRTAATLISERVRETGGRARDVT
jgi:hypothetical protein